MNQEMRDLLKLAETALDPQTDRDTEKRSMTRVLACLDTYRGVFGAEFMARLYARIDSRLDYYDRKAAYTRALRWFTKRK